jgi:hypothetical protein
VEGVRLAAVDRADSQSFNAKQPPPAKLEQTPVAPGLILALPFDARAPIPDAVAKPYPRAIAYFALPSLLGAALPRPSASPPPLLPPPPTPSASPKGYAPGTCRVHLHEHHVPCVGDDEDLAVDAVLYDNDGREIDRLPETKCNDKAPARWAPRKLPHALTITGEHRGDYVHLTYGGMSWQSKEHDKSKPAYCDN